MKQRIIVTGVALAALAFSSLPAIAQETTDSAAPTTKTPVKALLQLKNTAQEKRNAGVERQAEIKANIETRKAEVKANIEERKAEIKTNIETRKASTTEARLELKSNIEMRKASSTERRVERQEDLAKRQIEHVTKMLMATIERLEKILARIESRIEKLNAEGIDTTEAERYVAEAKAHLGEARVGIEALSSIDLSADKAKENLGRVRSVVAEVKASLKAAHESLMKAVRILKSSALSASSTSEQ